MGGWTWGGLAVVLLLVSGAARGEPELHVGFVLPADPADQLRPQVCLERDASRCGGVDEDGQLPLLVRASPGSLVWVGGELAAATPRGHVARVDPLAGVPDHPVFVSPGGWLHLSYDVRVEGPAGAGERRLELVPNEALRLLLDRRLRAGSGGYAWAAAFDPAAERMHPTLVVEHWVDRGGERLVDDLGRALPTLFVPSDLGTLRLRDLELVAVVRIKPKLLERCARCALGDFGWPETEFRCARVRLDSAVTVVEARTGKPVATRAFPGPPPGPCGENVDHLAVRGVAAPAIREWIFALARVPQGALLPSRP